MSSRGNIVVGIVESVIICAILIEQEVDLDGMKPQSVLEKMQYQMSTSLHEILMQRVFRRSDWATRQQGGISNRNNAIQMEQSRSPAIFIFSIIFTCQPQPPNFSPLSERMIDRIQGP